MAARVVRLGAHVPFGTLLAPGDAPPQWIVRENSEGHDEEILFRGTQVVWSAGQRLLSSFAAPSTVKAVVLSSFMEETGHGEKLCVLHGDGQLELHRQRGLCVPVALSLPIEAISPVPGGLILQTPDHALYSLFHPLAEPRRVDNAATKSGASGSVCFSSPTASFILLFDSDHLLLARLHRDADPEAAKTYDAACAPAPLPPSELSLVPLLRIPCPSMPTQTPFLIDSASADHSSLLCILIGSQLTTVSLPSASSSTSPAIEFTYPAISASPVRWKGSTALLLLSTPTNLVLLHKGTPVALLMPPSLSPSSVRRLAGAAGPRLTLVSDSSSERIEIREVFTSGLARDVAAALERAVPLAAVGILLFVAASPPDAQPDVEWKHLSSALNAALLLAPAAPAAASTDDWTALLQSSTHANPLNVCATRHLASPSVPLSHSASVVSIALPPPVVAELRGRAGQIVSALHTLYETLKLDSRRAASLATLGQFLAPLSAALGMPVYADLIRRDLAIPISPIGPNLANAPPPFSLLSWLIACLTPNATLPCLPSALPNELRVFLRLYTLLANRDDASLRPPGLALPVLSPAARVVMAMTQEGLTSHYLDTLPTGLSIPIREALYLVRPSPPALLGAAEHRLIGRTDLCTPVSLHLATDAASISAAAPPAAEDAPKEGITPFHPVSVLRFRADARLAELRSLLSSAQTISVVTKSGAEGDLQEQQAALLSKVHRTLALSVGRGAVTLTATEESSGGLQTPLTVALDVPPLVITGRVRNLGSPVTLDQSTLPADFAHWAEFHNGAAAALRLSPDMEGVSAPWIAYQRPSSEPSATHGGILLGLGLQGHLRCLALSQTQCAPLVFDYLHGHELTAVGIMLGMAATYRGSMHGAVVKMLCVHLPPFHPPASAELETLKEMPSVHPAALIGLGLVCQGSANRRQTEVLLDEIGRRPPDERRFSVESHTMAAGCALGLICLGREVPQGLADLKMLDRLCAYISGSKSTQAPHLGGRSALLLEGKHGNADATAPAAMCALALMFIQTNNKAAAAALSLPASFPALEIGRPDLLILRVLSRHLILWDFVEPSALWLDSLLPPFLSRQSPAPPPIDSYLQRDEELHALARLYIRTGGALSVAFRFAGTHHPQAVSLLLAELQNNVNRRAKDTDSKMLRAAIETCVALSAVSAAIVLSGSGDLRLLRLLRILHRRQSPQLHYGHQMLAHMAVGFLFLGGGRMAFSTSKEALAALLLSVYPSLPSSPNDSRHHLQALRHLYVLAAEPRCVACKDVDTDELCVIPMSVSLIPDFLPAIQSLSVSAPCLLPPWTSIRSLRLDTPRYFAREWDASSLDSLRRTRVVLVRRRPGFLPHAMDPRGTLSLLSHPIPRARFSVAGLARQQKQGAVLRSFAADPALHAFARHVCSEGEDADLAAFGNRMLHECLANDHIDALSSFLSLRQLLTHLSRERSAVAALALRVTLHFYSQPALLTVLYPREHRAPLCDAAYVAYASARVQAFFALKGYIGGANSATLLRKYFETGEVPDVAYGTFLSWLAIPSPHSSASLRAHTAAPAPIACKALQASCALSVSAAMLFISALK